MRYVLKTVYVRVKDEGKYYNGSFVHIYDMTTKKFIDGDNELLGLPADFLQPRHFKKVKSIQPLGEVFPIMQFDQTVLATNARLNSDHYLYQEEMGNYLQ